MFSMVTMSTFSQTPKQTSRWGSLLQQAVAGVESRLDTILADGDDAPVPPIKANGKKPAQHDSKESVNLSVSEGARVQSRYRALDRLRSVQLLISSRSFSQHIEWQKPQSPSGALG